MLKTKPGRWSVRIMRHDKFSKVWSSARVPGLEAQPISIWRPDFRGGNIQSGFRSLVSGGVLRQFLLGDLGVRGLDAPEHSLFLEIKAATAAPATPGLGLTLDAWIARYLPRPVAFRLLWHDRRGGESPGRKRGGTSEKGSLYVWRPVTPNGLFVALGAVCTTDATEPWDLDVRCVPKAWLVRGDSLEATLWSLGDRREVRVQHCLGGVIACPTDNLRFLPSWSFISHHFYVGS